MKEKEVKASLREEEAREKWAEALAQTEHTRSANELLRIKIRQAESMDDSVDNDKVKGEGDAADEPVSSPEPASFIPPQTSSTPPLSTSPSTKELYRPLEEASYGDEQSNGDKANAHEIGSQSVLDEPAVVVEHADAHGAQSMPDVIISDIVVSVHYVNLKQ